ncbi:MAG: CoA-binding protein [Lentisphaerae bacterium]|nr:CoA-binding protein [Lentisphaerota bacterium]
MAFAGGCLFASFGVDRRSLPTHNVWIVEEQPTRDTQTVAVLGASKKPARYSNKAVRLLKEHGHRVIPINPAERVIEGLRVSPSLASVSEAIDSLSVYVGATTSEKMVEDIISLAPGRVILNPGAESKSLEARLTESGIPVLNACTLVLLRTGQF